MGRERIEVFISSPSDVQPERVIVERMVVRLARQFASHFDISSIRWERRPLRATADFQSQIPRACRADIVIVILWWRLGSLLAENEYRGAISGQPVTGTEFEFEDAIQGENGKTPTLFVYQKQGVPRFTDKREIQEYLDQSAKVDRFFATWFKPKGLAYRTFSDASAFEEMLSDHLTEQIRRRIDTAQVESESTVVTWFEGSPFRGLEAFETIHAPVFFGRARAQVEVQQLLVRQIQSGQPWVVVLGASGSGKSSLVKAGLLPDITTPGLIEGVGTCRYATMRPSDAGGDLVAGLAQALMSGAALPELAELEYTPEGLAGILAAAPAHAGTPLKQGLAKARVRDGLLDHAAVRIAIVIDQLEELFSLQQATQRRAEFLRVLDALAATGAAWIIATLRTDFLPDLERSGDLAPRFDSNSRYFLSEPNEMELAQMIERPVQAAGLRFATDADTGIGLGDAIKRAARQSPAALPLLEYLLDQLWQRRTERGALTWDAYRELGELEGAIGSRAEQVYRELPDDARECLPKVLRALVTIAPGENSLVTAGYAMLDRFPPGTPSRALVDAFTHPNARLTVAFGDGTRRQVRLAHEALLSRWPRAKEHLAADAKDLMLRYRLDQQADLWRAARESSRLLMPGLPLSEALDLLSRRGDELNSSTIEFINASAAAYQDELEQERRRRMEAEWRESLAELSQFRAAAEEYYARAGDTRSRARMVEGETARWDHKEYAALLWTRSSELEREANRMLQSAYELHRSLRNHPGAQAAHRVDDGIFSLEALNCDHGECLIVHYGEAGDPRFVLIDGGSRVSFRRNLHPRLEELHARWARGGTLSIELVMVSHYDADRVAGVFELLKYMAGEGAGRYRIERLWFNNFQAILPKETKKSPSFKEELRELAEHCGIAVNAPFDYFVMPSGRGPTRLTLQGGLEITIAGPSFKRVKSWYRAWKQERERNLGLPRGMAAMFERLGLEETPEDSPEGESASNPALRLIRTPPAEFRPAFEPVGDESTHNVSSIVAHLRFKNRTMLLPGDARSDDILAGMFESWLFDPKNGMDVDVLKAPHFGSLHNCSRQLFSSLRAKHYLIPGAPRYGQPKPEVFDFISEARGGEGYGVYVSHQGPEVESKLQKIMERDSSARVVMAGDEVPRIVIDLLSPISY